MDILFSGLIKGPALFGLVGSVNHRHLILGRLFKGLASLPYLAYKFCWWLQQKLWQLKWAHLLTDPPALSAHLPCQPACLVSPPALSARLPCQPACLVSLPALSARLPCQPACLVSPPALSAHLFVFCLLLSLALVEVDLWANCYALSNVIYLDIYEK